MRTSTPACLEDYFVTKTGVRNVLNDEMSIADWVVSFPFQNRLVNNQTRPAVNNSGPWI